ncbi:MAG: 16S rRNA (cytosine(967)-C(5))-methyltransferase RsmB [Mobilitalea sp.]
MTESYNSREIVLEMLLEVLEGGKFSHTVQNQTLKRYQMLEKQERAFLSRVFSGTVKVYLTLDYIIEQFSTLPVRKMKPFIRNLLRMSVYQLCYMDQIPSSAVCNEAVKLAKKRGFDKLSGFVNGILRNITRNEANIKFPDKQLDPIKYLEISYSYPQWLVSELLTQYDFATVEIILAASLKEKELTIRTNLQKVTPQELKEILLKEGVTVEESDYLPYAFKLKNYDYLEKLEAFQKGYFTVQDVSSMLVCEVAGISEKDLVVDVCAAPGGKTMHAAQTAGSVLARDLTEYKVGLINENIKRLELTNILTKVWDASILDEELVDKADVVIADLPCSGMGVFGKKADLKYKFSPNQQKELVELQRKILSVIQSYVKEGGVLMFSTCTINHGENTANMEWFLNNFDFSLESLNTYLPDELKSETTEKGYLQLLQGVHPTDGFFIAKFRRKRN